ncbi:hypothetical protein [Candidatus Cardinium hertigii]|nr:hypothetical protein [Candidatus Cardinium hertigii]
MATNFIVTLGMMLYCIACNSSHNEMDRQSSGQSPSAGVSGGSNANESNIGFGISCAKCHEETACSCFSLCIKCISTDSEDTKEQIESLNSDPKLFNEIIRHSLLDLERLMKGSDDIEDIEKDHHMREYHKFILNYLKKDLIDLLELLPKDTPSICFDICNNTITLQDVIRFFRKKNPDENTKNTLFSIVTWKLERSQIEDLKSQYTEKQIQAYRDILYFLYKEGIDVNKCQYYPARFGASNGNSALMRIISSGRELINQDQDKAISLMFLRDFKSDPFAPHPRDKKNALHFLLLKGHPEQKASLDTVLGHPLIRDHINDQTIYGDTALHIACARRDMSIIIRLLEKGAADSLDVSNCFGKKPFELMQMSEEKRLQFLLLYLNASDDTFSDTELCNLSSLPLCDEQKRWLNCVATINSSIFNSDPKLIEKCVTRRIS